MTDPTLRDFVRGVLPSLSETRLRELLQFFSDNDVLAPRDAAGIVRKEDLRPFMSALQAQKLINDLQALVGTAPVTEREKLQVQKAEVSVRHMEVTVKEKSLQLKNRNGKDSAEIFIAASKGALMGAGSVALGATVLKLALSDLVIVPVVLVLAAGAAGAAVGGAMKVVDVAIDRERDLASFERARGNSGQLAVTGQCITAA